METRTEDRELLRLVSIQAGTATLEGELALPPAPRGLVLFAHGSGSGRHSPRNRYVAQSLRSTARVGTLLFDLLSAQEEQADLRTGELRFDIELLASRLVAATDWAKEDREMHGLRFAYFGASTGAAAALVAATVRTADIGAVVSRGGRPDLAGPALLRVRAPTLFLVGGEDYPVIDINRTARAMMSAPSELELIPDASHLFKEPGALEKVARQAGRWFDLYL